MTPLRFYREQAALQRAAAEAATLQNVRERCQRAADSWTALASKSEQVELQRAASQKPGEVCASQPNTRAPVHNFKVGV